MIKKQLAWIPLILSATNVFAQTKQQEENLYTFSKLYGYVRYFHPSDANVVTDWEKFAIYGAEQVDKATNKQELQQTLEALFHPIAPSLHIYPAGSKSTFKLAAIQPADAKKMKSVTWQHTGYGAGSNSQTYRSFRTNSFMKEVRPYEKAPFSTINGTVDAKPYQGRPIRLSAAVKAKDLTNGKGQIWMRVDRPDNKPGFFNNMGDRPFTGKDAAWRRDTIVGKVDQDAIRIALGCFIVGNGSLLLDDMKLEIQMEDGWKTLPLNGDFEEYTEGWAYNQDDALFRVKTSPESAVLGKQSLSMDRGYLGNYTSTTLLFNEKPLAAGTTIQRNIGSGLAITMPVALWGDGERTWPLTDTSTIVQMNKEYKARFDSLTAENLYVRLAGALITWNVFQHFHPYYKEWTTDWDKDLRIAIAGCYQDKNPDEYLRTLQKLAAKIRDGHTGVYMSRKNTHGYLPLAWAWIEDQLVVTKVLSSSVDLKKGDVITAINGIPAKKYIDSIMPRISAGAPHARMAGTLGDMSFSSMNTPLQLTTQNKQISVAYSVTQADYYRLSYDTISSYRQIDPDHLYVNLSYMPWDSMKGKLNDMAQAKTLIVDMRGYPKDMNGSYIIQHLIKKSEKNKWMQRQRLTLPDHEKTAWDGVGWDVQPSTPHIAGKVFFLTNSNAISYAESVMGYIKGLKLGTIIGEPTAGANGDINYVSLPGGYTFSFTGLKVTNHDGSQHYMKGIQPDVLVPRTIQGIREGRDEVLEKAIALSNQ